METFALLTKHPRHLAVIDLAAQKAGWGKPLPRGRGRAIAVHFAFESYNAQVAEEHTDLSATADNIKGESTSSPRINGPLQTPVCQG
jgi:hypothetical protein